MSEIECTARTLQQLAQEAHARFDELTMRLLPITKKTSRVPIHSPRPVLGKPELLVTLELVEEKLRRLVDAIDEQNELLQL